MPIASLRSDHGKEFEQLGFDTFCFKYGISHNLFAPKTPQWNGVVERKNRTLEDMSRTMLIENELPKTFWAEALNTANYVLNRLLIRPILKRLLMNYSKEKLQIFLILNHLVVYVKQKESDLEGLDK